MNTFASHPGQVTIFSGLSLSLIAFPYYHQPFSGQGCRRADRDNLLRLPGRLFDKALTPSRQREKTKKLQRIA
jgi:hypothetical protein